MYIYPSQIFNFMDLKRTCFYYTLVWYDACISSLKQVISTSLRMGGRTTQVCGTQIERVVRRRERRQRHLTENNGDGRSENLINFEVLL